MVLPKSAWCNSTYINPLTGRPCYGCPSCDYVARTAHNLQDKQRWRKFPPKKNQKESGQ